MNLKGITKMTLENLYFEIEKRIDKIDFGSLYKGFYRFQFALYNDEQAFLECGYIDKPSGFIGNTAVKYEGKDIAIWHIVDASPDLDVLASKIVHEMLHAYQHAKEDKRFADERGAMVKYHYDEINMSTKLVEAELMQKCLTQDSPEDLKKLISLRKLRSDRFAYEYDYESRVEQIEGTANYVELSALSLLDPDKAKKAWEKLFEDILDSDNYFPIRIITYYTGAAFIACLKKYTDYDTDEFSNVPFAIGALDLDKSDSGVTCLPESDEKVKKSLNAWRSQQSEVITKAIEKNDLVLDGEYRLAGFNVYDACWDGKYAIISYFMGYIEGFELPTTDEEFFAKMKTLNGNFVAEVDEELRLFRVWRRD